MNCDELLPHLPLLALEEGDPAVSEEAADHLRGCPRCQERLAELTRTCAALDLAVVADAAPLTGAQVRAAARQLPLHATVGPSIGWRRAAAAALLLGVALGAGFLGGSLPQRARDGAAAGPAGIPTAVLAEAILSLEERFALLEQRHDRDLLALAEAVDRQQLRRDEGVAREIATLARNTRAQLIDTRLALDGVAQLIPPYFTATAAAPTQEH